MLQHKQAKLTDKTRQTDRRTGQASRQLCLGTSSSCWTKTRNTFGLSPSLPLALSLAHWVQINRAHFVINNAKRALHRHVQPARIQTHTNYSSHTNTHTRMLLPQGNAQYAVSCAQTWCNYCKLRLKSTSLSPATAAPIASVPLPSSPTPLSPLLLLAFCSRQRHLYLMTFQHRVRVRRDVFLRLFWLHAYCIKTQAPPKPTTPLPAAAAAATAALSTS